ncbi:ATP-binding protein [Streptomyces sp. NPDC058251]|uniref:ATP-binding protein n=1 Tax=unclassified Streptomyces TaxID=2593676 RepID=UPI00365AA70F
MTPTETVNATSAGQAEGAGSDCAHASVGSPQGAASHLQTSLPSDPRSALTARRVTRTALAAWGVEEEAVECALLVVSELVTNAVEHALPPITLRLVSPPPSHDGAIHIAVDDGGPAAEEGSWIRSCSEDEHGRGSGIIDSVATAQASTTHANGATHWAELPAA